MLYVLCESILMLTVKTVNALSLPLQVRDALFHLLTGVYQEQHLAWFNIRSVSRSIIFLCLLTDEAARIHFVMPSRAPLYLQMSEKPR